MPSNEMNNGWKNKYNFSKVELHCHLDGCYSVPTVAEIGKKRGIALPSYDTEELRKYITIDERSSLEDYISYIELALKVFRGCPESIARLTREAIENKSKEGIVYLELRYSPQLMANCEVDDFIDESERGTLRPRDVVEVINKTVKESEQEFGITVRTILCQIMGKNWGIETAKLCEEYASQGVVGIDFSRYKEPGNFTADVYQAYDFCWKNGIHRTSHAGEVDPPSRVKEAVEKLHVQRIGHGYRVVTDETCYDVVKKHRTHMEVCPLSSHYTTGAPEDWTKHPALRFHADNINFSLSTDAPGVQQTTMLDEYDTVTAKFNFTIEDLKKLNLNAARSCFLKEAEKEQLVYDLEREYCVNDVLQK